MKQKALDDNFTSLERNTAFSDKQVQELTAKTLFLKTVTTSVIHKENWYIWRPTVYVKI